MYQTRMIGYYPKVIQSILEFQAIVDGEYPEIENVSSEIQNVISDAYLLTMSENRIIQWENILGIRAIESSSLDDRRETIIARIRGQGKLNSELISSIVKTFTDGACESWIEDSTLNVRLLPSQSGKEYLLENVIQEIVSKVPSHLAYSIVEAWQLWNDVNNSQISWQSTKNTHTTWKNVLYNIRTKPNGLDESRLDSFVLA